MQIWIGGKYKRDIGRRGWEAANHRSSDVIAIKLGDLQMGFPAAAWVNELGALQSVVDQVVPISHKRDKSSFACHGVVQVPKASRVLNQRQWSIALTAALPD